MPSTKRIRKKKACLSRACSAADTRMGGAVIGEPRLKAGNNTRGASRDQTSLRVPSNHERFHPRIRPYGEAGRGLVERPKLRPSNVAWAKNAYGRDGDSLSRLRYTDPASRTGDQISFPFPDTWDSAIKMAVLDSPVPWRMQQLQHEHEREKAASIIIDEPT